MRLRTSVRNYQTNDRRRTISHKRPQQSPRIAALSVLAYNIIRTINLIGAANLKTVVVVITVIMAVISICGCWNHAAGGNCPNHAHSRSNRC
jgi:hypothetical protein